MITHQFTDRIFFGATPLETIQDVSAEQAILLEAEIPESSTDLEVALAFTLANLKSIRMVANQDLTIKLNSNAAAALETISLLAGKPFTWRSADGYFRNPLLGDPEGELTEITSIFVTGADATTLYVQALVDPTP